MPEINPTYPQWEFMSSEDPYPAFVGGFGCVHPDTKIWTEHGLMRIADIDRPIRVVSWSEKDQRFQLSLSGGAFPKGKASLYRVTTQQGEFVASEHHRIFSSSGNYLPVRDLQQSGLSSSCLAHSSLEFGRLLSSLSAQHYSRTDANSLGSYADAARLYGQQFLQTEDSDQGTAPLSICARVLRRRFYPFFSLRVGGLLGRMLKRTHRGLSFFLKQKNGYLRPVERLAAVLVDQTSALCAGHTSQSLRDIEQSALMSERHHKDLQSVSVSHSLLKSPVLSVALVEEPLPYYDMQVLDTNNYVCEAGFIHHNSGKTEALVNRAILGKFKYPTLNRAFYEPTFDLVRQIAWPRFESALESLDIPYKLTKSPMNQIEIEGAGKIIFRSMERPERIIGYEVADSDIDELDTLKTENAAYAWRQIIARNRQPKPDGMANSIGVATTPEGFRFVYNTWGKSPRKGYQIIKAPTMSNPHLPSGYVDSLRDIYPEHLLDAYLNGDFVNLSNGTVYKSYDRKSHNSSETIKQGEPLFIGMDFNVTKQAATVWVKRKGGKEWHAVDELVDMYDTPEAVKIIQERFSGHRITIYPDASGGSRKTVDASKSDISLLESAKFSVRAHKTNPGVKDRINATNAAFERGILFVNAYRCPTTASCLEQQVYDNNGQPDKKSGNDHQNDATTYPIAYEMPINRPVAAIKLSFAR